MKLRFILFFSVIVGAVCQISGQIVSDEVLNFGVMFKWGLIEKEAGLISLTTEVNEKDGYFTSELIGVSTSVAEKFYSVRDTLRGKILIDGIEPVYYEKIAHEGGVFRRDEVRYFRDGTGNVSAMTSLYKVDKKGNVTEDGKEFSATGVTLDMLSAFYYMRHIDYDNMDVGESVVYNIFSARKKETLRITYLGTQDLKLNKHEASVPTYHISFTFTSDVNKKAQSSDPIEAWMAQDDSRTPYQVVGKLPVGKIRCRLKSKN